MSFDDEMFKTFPGDNHPWEIKKQQVKAKDIKVAMRFNEPWSDEEIVAVMFAEPPTTYDEMGALLFRTTGTIHGVKSYIRKAILHPEQFRKNGVIPSRYGIVRRIYRLLDEHGVRDWPQENQEAIARLLPGRRETYERAALYLARNLGGE